MVFRAFALAAAKQTRAGRFAARFTARGGLVVALATALSCGGPAEPAPNPDFAGTASGEPALESNDFEVPPLPFTPSSELRELVAFIETSPRLLPPPATSDAELSAWAELVFRPWMTERTARLREAQELAALAEQHDGMGAVMAGLQAMLLSDMASNLSRLGDGDSSLTEDMATALAEPVGGLLRRADVESEVCSERSLAAGTPLDAWLRACNRILARTSRLRADNERRMARRLSRVERDTEGVERGSESDGETSPNDALPDDATQNDAVPTDAAPAN